jgi:hypothetical protein
MQSSSDRATRGCRNDECRSLDAASATRFFLSRPSLPHGPMTASRPNVLEQPTGRRANPRLTTGRVPSWTGRSAVACATDSHLSTLATAGTRVTRVSAMRLLPAPAERTALWKARVVTGQSTPQRRMDPGPLVISG